MNRLILEQKREFFEEVADLIKTRGYRNNFLLPDLLELIKPQKSFSLQQLKEYWEEHVDKIKKGEAKDNINFYINIPFCRTKCHYCIYNVKIAKSENEIDLYIDRLVSQFKEFSGVFKEIKFKSLYVGGGTPSILSERQIKKLLENLFANFDFENKGEKTFECNPDSMSCEKLELLNKYHINRVSFGVQSLNEKVLKSENRGYQEFRKIKELILKARSLKFRDINVDLMIGLQNDNPKIVYRDIMEIKKLKPHSISVYPLQPTKIYLDKHFREDVNKSFLELDDKMESVLRLCKSDIDDYDLDCPNSTTLGTASAWGFDLKGWSPNTIDYSYDTEKESSCFGLGINACSYIFNRIRYRFQDDELIQGLLSTATDQKIHYILSRLAYKQNVVFVEYRKVFNRDLMKDFNEAIKQLENLQIVKVDKNQIVLLVQNNKERFVNCMFFFEFSQILDKYLELRINGHREKSMNFILGHKCNNNCIFCWDNNRYSRINLDNESVSSQIKTVLQDNPEEIYFTGGEPTLYPKELIKLMKFFIRKGVKKISIVTNGRRFSSEKFTNALINNGLNYAIIAVHGQGRTHDKITQVEGAYLEVIQGIKNLVKKDIGIRINYVCIKDNLSEILPTVKTLHEIGVTKFNIQRFVIKGRSAANYTNLRFSPKDFKRYLKEIVSYLEQNPKVQLEFEFFSNDFFGMEYRKYAPKLTDSISFLEEANLNKGDCYLDIKNKKLFCDDCFLRPICAF